MRGAYRPTKPRFVPRINTIQTCAELCFATRDCAAFTLQSLQCIIFTSFVGGRTVQYNSMWIKKRIKQRLPEGGTGTVR